MIQHLVLSGTHQQYLSWLATAGLSVADYQPADVMMVRVVVVDELLTFDQVGTYWQNPVFGSELYRQLMADGVALGMPWAIPWEADFLKATSLRERAPAVPVTQAEVDQVASAQLHIERLLRDDV